MTLICFFNFALNFAVIVAFYNQKICTISNAHDKAIRLNAKNERKNLFFKIVDYGLRDQYTIDDLTKIFKFCKYANNEMALPTATKHMHEPCEEYIDGLKAMPWWEKSQFEWVSGLEKNSTEIVNELINAELKHMFISDSKYQQTMGTGWTAFRLQRFGQWNAENCALFPKTVEILKSLRIPLAMRGVMFAKQLPRTGVQPHSDGRNFILTAHLGLKIPQDYESCWMKVGGIKKSWKQNEVIILDTSFVHETMNDTNEDRYVLILDFWHPDLTLVERQALAYIYDSRNKFDGGDMYSIKSSYWSIEKDSNVNVLKSFINSIWKS